MSQASENSNLLDFTGVFLSVLCAIHCTLGPLLILFVPALGGFFGNESFHLLMFLAIVPVAGLTFVSHYKKHRSKLTLGLAMTAITLLFAGLMAGHSHEFFSLFSSSHAHHAHAHHHHDAFSESLEHVLTVSGSVLIVIAHILNIRHCRCLKAQGTCSH